MLTPAMRMVFEEAYTLSSVPFFKITLSPPARVIDLDSPATERILIDVALDAVFTALTPLDELRFIASSGFVGDSTSENTILITLLHPQLLRLPELPGIG